MELSLFIVRTLAIIYLAVALGLILYKDAYMNVFQKLAEHEGYALLGGFMAVVGGMALVTYHNVWVNDWRVVVTVVGWIALLKGVLLLIVPSYAGIFKNLLQPKMRLPLTLVLTLVGLAFMYLGFIR